jgi:hypothetical protein
MRLPWVRPIFLREIRHRLFAEILAASAAGASGPDTSTSKTLVKALHL